MIKIILSSSNTESDDMKQNGNLKGKDKYSEKFFRNMSWLIKQLQDIIINLKESELKTLISYVAPRLDENKIGSEYSIRLIMLKDNSKPFTVPTLLFIYRFKVLFWCFNIFIVQK